MLETWHLIFDRQTSVSTQYGLMPVADGYSTIDNAVHINLKNPFKIRRDRFSYSPVFIYIGAKWIMMGSHYLNLLSLLKKAKVKLEIDIGYVIDYLNYQCPWTYGTLCKQIQILRNAEEISISTDGTRYRRFDSFITEQNTAPDIKRYLSSELEKLDFKKSVFHISSGLDSSLLVLVASTMLSPKEITTVSCETLGHGASNELDIVKKLAKDVGCSLEVYDFRNVNVFDAGKALIQKCLGYPIAHPSHLVEYLIDKSVSDSFDVIVSGRGPDECLAGYSWHKHDYRHKERYLSRMRVTPHSVMRNLFKEEFSLPPDQFESHIANVSGNLLSLHDRLEIDQRMIAEAWGIVHSGVELGLGVLIAKPFHNPRLTESLFNLDESMMVRGSTQKVYLRESMGSYYFDYLLNVPKQGLRLDLKPYLEKANNFLDEILESEFANHYFNKSEVIKLHRNTINGVENYGWQLWSIYLLVNSSELIYN